MCGYVLQFSRCDGLLRRRHRTERGLLIVEGVAVVIRAGIVGAERGQPERAESINERPFTHDESKSTSSLRAALDAAAAAFPMLDLPILHHAA